MARYNNSFKGRRSGPKRSFQQNRRRSYGGGRGRRGVRSFDPFHLIKNSQKDKVLTKLEEIKIDHKFTDFRIDQRIKDNITSKGYEIPTPIQDKTIPLIIQGGDVVGVANTGTGKTAAFLIPLINKTLNKRGEKVLIITPTRELAVQIEQEFISIAQGLGIYSSLCIGGVGINRQIQRLRRHPQFVIGTPGRLKDLGERRVLKLGEFSNIVLDEVDRMLDMGFIHDVNHLISFFPQRRQSLFFSATIKGDVEKVMGRFLNQPTIISVKTKNITDNVAQEMVRCAGKNKVEVLHDLLIQDGFDRVLVFGRTKWGMEKLSKELIKRGFRATAIHGNKSQNQRQRALKEFKTGQVNVLLATDVAQRGLDIDSVTHVINFDLPETEEDYIHRIGRTGRADKKGYAITLMP